MSVVIYQQYIIPPSQATDNRAPNANVGFFCDTFAELPTGVATIDGDTAYCVDVAIRYVRTGGAWVISYANNIASNVLETGGPLSLAVGAIEDGQYLRRVGSAIVGSAVSGAGATTGSATLAFGSEPACETSVVVTGQSGIVAGSKVDAWVSRTTTASNGADEHEMAASMLSVIAGDIVEGVGFTLKALSQRLLATGDFSVNWRWA